MFERRGKMRIKIRNKDIKKYKKPLAIVVFILIFVIVFLLIGLTITRDRNRSKDTILSDIPVLETAKDSAVTPVLGIDDVLKDKENSESIAEDTKKENENVQVTEDSKVSEKEKDNEPDTDTTKTDGKPTKQHQKVVQPGEIKKLKNGETRIQLPDNKVEYGNTKEVQDKIDTYTTFVSDVNSGLSKMSNIYVADTDNNRVYFEDIQKSAGAKPIVLYIWRKGNFAELKKDVKVLQNANANADVQVVLIYIKGGSSTIEKVDQDLERNKITLVNYYDTVGCLQGYESSSLTEGVTVFYINTDGYKMPYELDNSNLAENIKGLQEWEKTRIELQETLLSEDSN